MLLDPVEDTNDYYHQHIPFHTPDHVHQSIEAMDKIARLFGMTVDELIHPWKVPKEVTIEDKMISEMLRLIEQLEKEGRQALYRIIDTMLTKSKFKDFFQKNILD